MNPGDTCVRCLTCGYKSDSLNEGRGVNPGDTSAKSCPERRFDNAQRRPGREPRRHPRCRGAGAGAAWSLNEGRGVNPGDTRLPGPTCPRLSSLNEGRGVNPGDTPCAARAPRRWTPLNEGRGVNPGDTSEIAVRSETGRLAQRRPGREPRRHSRSIVRWLSPGAAAQRRPGREPRRHEEPADAEDVAPLRSTKAGA